MTKTELIALKKYVSQIDLSSEEAYDILFEAFTQRFTMSMMWFPIKKESYVFRSRNNNCNEDFCLFSDLSYPQAKDVKTYSRANKPGQQVFYASDNYATNLTELLPFWLKEIPLGESFSVTTGIWGFTKSIIVAVIPDISNERMMPFIEKISELSQESIIKDYWTYINSFFKAQGFYEPSVYKFTSAFCNALLHNLRLSGIQVDGVLYTSVQDPSGWNIATTPESVDSNLFLKDVVKHFIKKNDFKNGKPVYDNLSGAVNPKKLDTSLNKIIWL